MFDIYTEKLGHMQSIQYKIWAVRGEKPFEHLDSTKHDVFLISNSLHFTYLETHQILKKMEMIPAPFSIYKVLHYQLQLTKDDDFSYFNELKYESAKVITSSLFLVTTKSETPITLSAIRDLGFVSNRISEKHFKDIVVLEAYHANAFMVDGIKS